MASFFTITNLPFFVKKLRFIGACLTHLLLNWDRIHKTLFSS
jgi:hypothetical protein